MATASTALRVTLIVSLALNLFAAGAFASHAWHHRGHGMHRWHQARAMHPYALKRVLPEADRKLLEDAIPAHREKIHERLSAVHEARKGVADALRAEPFDQQKLEAAFKLVRKREAAVAEESQQLLIQLAGRASPEGREKLAEQMLRRRDKMGR